jgi:hypothetical protein
MLSPVCTASAALIATTPAARPLRPGRRSHHERAGRHSHPRAGYPWLVALTVILLVSGHWNWAILTGAGTVANTVFLVYRIRQG